MAKSYEKLNHVACDEWHIDYQESTLQLLFWKKNAIEAK